jgi:hypothetical protein
LTHTDNLLTGGVNEGARQCAPLATPMIVVDDRPVLARLATSVAFSDAR